MKLFGLDITKAATAQVVLPSQSVTTPTGPLFTTTPMAYTPSYNDTLVMPSGQKFTPQTLAMLVREAESGRSGSFDFFKDEMLAMDGHLYAEIIKQQDYVTSAIMDAIPYPVFPSPIKGGRLTGDALKAHDVAAFLDVRYLSPEWNRDEALPALMDGEWKGIGGYQITAEPNPFGPEIITSLVHVPSSRFVTQMYLAGQGGATVPRLMFQPTGAMYPLIPLEELGPNGTATLVVHQVEASVPSPARRGVLRRCLNYWIIKHRGLVWWVQFVQNLGTPPLLGFFDPAQVGAQAVLNAAFNALGSGARMTVPIGTKIEPLNVASAITSETSHERIIDWCDRQVSRVVSGHDQSSGVQKDAGSKQSSDISDEQGMRRAQSRASRLARTIRDQDAKPAVAREFGPEIAAKFTSLISMRIDRPADLLGLATAFEGFAKANITTIPVAEFHKLSRLRQAGEGEPTIQPVVPKVAAPIVADAPAAKVLPFAAATSAQSTDPAAVLEELLKKAEKSATGAGDELVAPFREIIAAAVAEGATPQQVVMRIMHRLRTQVDAPDLTALLAATIAEATRKGLEIEAKRHG